MPREGIEALYIRMEPDDREKEGITLEADVGG